MGMMKRFDERADLMGRMMRTVGAADGMPADVTLGNTLRSAAQRCLGCEKPEVCSHWLDEHRDGAARAPDYCPNADLFAEWSARAQG